VTEAGHPARSASFGVTPQLLPRSGNEKFEALDRMLAVRSCCAERGNPAAEMRRRAIRAYAGDRVSSHRERGVRS
jgi:hypothetical protein